MNINKINKMKSGKYKIEFSDASKLVTYDDVILKNNLLFSKDIDSDVLNQINIDTDYYDIYNKCVKYISKRLRSEKEMRVYLDKFSLVCDIVDKIINDLKKINLINDIYFVKAYISDRLYLSNDGPSKIASDLVSHNISEDDIYAGLSSVSSSLVRDKLDKLIKKRIRLNHKYSNYMLKQKIYNDMINLGYDKDMIEECFSSNVLSDKSNLVKEFEKLYNKFCKDSKWELKVRQKLYQKGYSIDEINSLINERVS